MTLPSPEPSPEPSPDLVADLDDEQARWDALLASDGMRAIPLRTDTWTGGIGLVPALVDVATEGIEWAGPTLDYERSRAESRRKLWQLAKWLPASDQDTLDLHLQGLTQVQIGRVLDLAQSSVCTRLQRVRERIRMLGSGPLPDDRQHLHDLVEERWPGRGAFLVTWSRTWAGERAAHLLGMPQGTGWIWQRRASELADDDPVGHLARSIRALPAARLRGQHQRRG